MMIHTHVCHIVQDSKHRQEYAVGKSFTIIAL